MIKLDDRLLSVAGIIDKSSTVADIGTDHGYLAKYLLEQNICDRVIASDISNSSINKAKTNCSQLSDKIDFRTGFGTENIKKGECDIAVIAGIGGNNIIDILKRDNHKTAAFILQPMGYAERVRRFLSVNGYIITAEDLVLDNRRFYHIIKTETGTAENLSVIETELGPCLIKMKHPVLKLYIEWQLARYRRMASSIDTAQSERNKRVFAALTDRIKRYEEVYKCFVQ